MKKLILDTHCEIYDLLKPWADGLFWNLEEHISSGNLVSDAVYVIGREQIKKYSTIVRQLVNENTIKVIFSNPAEGSDTLRMHCKVYGIENLVLQKKILLIGGGEMGSEYAYLMYDSFLSKILDYDENISAQTRTDEIFSNILKPYKFFFLNGRIRPHRKFLLEKFNKSGLLDKCIWSCLDSNGSNNRNIRLLDDNKNLMSNPSKIQYLAKKYEHPRYQSRTEISTTDGFVKYDLFNNEWGEVYIEPQGYIDSFFSLVTETVFEYPYSFRTEKIWKPVAVGHPWVAVANQGFYRDIRNLGFQTFGHLIDESFDLIENNQDRIERIAELVEDLCQQDLATFLKECYNVCKYNQQHLAEMRIKVRQEFPDRFFKFLKQYNFDE